jgi:hypothetical protein
MSERADRVRTLLAGAGCQQADRQCVRWAEDVSYNIPAAGVSLHRRAAVAGIFDTMQGQLHAQVLGVLENSRFGVLTMELKNPTPGMEYSGPGALVQRRRGDQRVLGVARLMTRKGLTPASASGDQR